jgi:hypothetical protein
MMYLQILIYAIFTYICFITDQLTSINGMAAYWLCFVFMPAMKNKYGYRH